MAFNTARILAICLLATRVIAGPLSPRQNVAQCIWNHVVYSVDEVKTLLAVESENWPTQFQNADKTLVKEWMASCCATEKHEDAKFNADPQSSFPLGVASFRKPSASSSESDGLRKPTQDNASPSDALRKTEHVEQPERASLNIPDNAPLVQSPADHDSSEADLVGDEPSSHRSPATHASAKAPNGAKSHPSSAMHGSSAPTAHEPSEAESSNFRTPNGGESESEQVQPEHESVDAHERPDPAAKSALTGNPNAGTPAQPAFKNDSAKVDASERPDPAAKSASTGNPNVGTPAQPAFKNDAAKVDANERPDPVTKAGSPAHGPDVGAPTPNDSANVGANSHGSNDSAKVNNNNDGKHEDANANVAAPSAPNDSAKVNRPVVHSSKQSPSGESAKVNGDAEEKDAPRLCTCPVN